jgi:hypothetical protein
MASKPSWRTEWRSQRAANAARRVWVALSKNTFNYDAITDGHLLTILIRLRKSAQKEAQELADMDGVLLGPTGWLACKPPEWNALMQEASTRGRRFFGLASLLNDKDIDPVEILMEFRRFRGV